MKKRLIDNPIRRSVFLSRGVPHYILLGNYPSYFESAVTRVEVQRDDGMKTIKPELQRKMLQATLDDPLETNYFYAFGADNGDALSSQIALRIMLEAFDKDPMGSLGKPYWHVIDGSTKDKLRDSDEFREIQVGKLSMLILSGVASNSTAMKIEKLRDLLIKFSFVPRIVVISGAEPMSFCSNVLFMKPTRIMYFGKKGE